MGTGFLIGGFAMKDHPRILGEALTFDDVLLIPVKSELQPKDVDVRSFMTRKIALNIPLLSAAMDTVTESELAIALAREGGIGIIHKNFTIDRQAEEVDKVKRSESGMIMNPITLGPEALLREALDLMEKYRISGVPITKPDGTLVGILTNRDIRFAERIDARVSEFMTATNLVTVPVGTTLEMARSLLQEHKIEKLPVVDKDGRLKGLITVKDIQKKFKYPKACKDEHGRLRVGAAVGVSGDVIERVSRLCEVSADVVVVDSAHGHSRNVLDTVSTIKAEFPEVEVIGGNVSTREGARDLVAAGADAIKVGMGPGASCTTRIVAGIGVPQITAVMECVEEVGKAGVPIIADGGIKYSGDLVKALAAGASSVMIGNLFAGTAESPGERILLEGRAYKVFRGMGSVGAMREGSGDRYFQEGVEESKFVSEGIEGRVPFKGPLHDLVYQLVGGLRSGMGYCGVKTMDELRTRTRFQRITTAGLRESHPHDVTITKEAPNYELR
jgi:IMP dehydrogenase